MDRFDELATFVAVVDAGSFVAAAESLNRSTASVSRQISALEERLDVRLLHRTTRRQSLSAEGDVFLSRARAILDELDEAEAEVTARSAQAVGELRVNAPVSFGIQHLAELWDGFLAMHPRVRLDLTLSDRHVDLVEEGFDVAIRISRLRDSTLVSRQLAGTRMMLCASPGYLADHGDLAHPDQLQDHRIWAYRHFSEGEAWNFDGPSGPVKARIRPVAWINNGDTCRAAALNGHCIVLQPSFLVGNDIRAGRLVELLPGFRAGTLGIHALYPTRRHVAPRVRLLIDYLADALRAAPWDI